MASNTNFENAARNSSIILLVGMMGSGKSAIGKLLAEKLHRDFFDSDTWIESARKKNVSEIFSEEGEETFRKYEREAIRTLLKKENIIIATGGGAFIDARNREEIQNAHAHTIWLRASLDTIMSRLKRDTSRPLLEKNKKATLEKLLTEREPIYALADIHITTDKKNVEKSVKEILSALSLFPSPPGGGGLGRGGARSASLL